MVENIETSKLEGLIKNFDETDGKKKKVFLMGGILTILLAGIGTGYVLTNRRTGSTTSSVKKTNVPKGTTAGLDDEKTFKDTAEGILEKGGLNGEGSHKLIREGGPSQTAYLTSSAVNLDDFIGNKVKIWGETFQGQEAGWLMDVGKIEVLE